MYSFDSTIRYSECDDTGRLTLASVVNYLQDCASFHSESVGHGLSFMAEHHFAWFIAAWQIQIERMPRFCEHVSISTNCYKSGGMVAQRNFSIRDDRGTYLVKADSIWFTFDTREHKACHIPASEDVYVSDDPQLDLPRTTQHLRVKGEGELATPIVVSEQHLDTNHHVNNAQYVAMAEAVARAKGLLPQDTHRILVQYRQMALLGDTIVPHLHVTERGCTVDLDDPDGKIFAIVAFEGPQDREANHE